ncbi:MAG TPA: tripartite tricarboxylate transporter substrate binding protein [Usitatibacter sp.]|nr:tripartite tricarboxylate transporter substrate binding protein [Usitatibacter sp.]
MKRIAAFVQALSMAIFLGAGLARAAYPEKPIRLVVGFPAGSQPDIVARMLARSLAPLLEQPVVVENLTGAAGNIAADHLARAAPDGYTLGLLSQTHIVVNPSLYKLPYDPVKDFAPVSQVAVSPQMLVVNNAVPAKSVGELVALARSQPGTLTFASSGTGSGTHMAAELFKSAASLDIRHIPYKGVVAAVPDLMGARVTMMFSPIPVVWPLVREGKLRALAVTSAKRSRAAPDVPTVAESGYPGFEATNWYGLLAPAKTPAAIVEKLHSATVKALAHPGLRDKLSDLGLEAIGNSPQEFAAAIRSETPKWARLIRAAGIKPE